MRTLLALGLPFLAVTLPAQQDPAAGYGSHRFFDRGAVDLKTPTGSDFLLGVQKLGDRLYVTGRGLGSAITPPHTVYVLDFATGKLLGSHAQDPTTSTSAWGWRDLATDGKGLFCGFEGGIHFTDTSGKLVNQVAAKNGTQTLAQNPIPLPSSLFVARGLAYDPGGNGGNGSLWTADFDSDLVELALDGKVLRSFPVTTNSPGWSIYGLAFDPRHGTLWANSAPDMAELREIDLQSGKFLAKSQPIRRYQPTSSQGGLCAEVGGDGSFFLIGLDQGSPDTVCSYRVDNVIGLPGESEAIMQNGISSLRLDAAKPKLFATTPQDLWFRWDFSLDPTLKGRPGLVFVNFGSSATGLGTTPGFPELVARWFASVPPANDALLVATVLTDTPISLTLPALPLQPGDSLRMQMVYFEPKVPQALVATNQIGWEFEDHPVLVRATGANSFNTDTSAGFFQVENLGATGISEVVFDWTKAINAGQASMRFDTDQDGMADRFDAGDSSTSGCRGTYRNGCDQATGLVYDVRNQLPATCAIKANTGWIGSNPGGVLGDFRTLTFRFDPAKFRMGARFEVDIDTDGGLGIDGGSMESMYVQVKLADNRVLSGNLKRVDAELSLLKLR